MKSLLKAWLPIAVTATILIGFVYAALQQTIRLSYNWPQVDIVNDASYQLTHGMTVDALLKKYSLTTPIDTTGSAFLNVYSEDGRAMGGDGYLDGQLATPPVGYLQNSDSSPSYHAQTWAPQPDVRIAAVAQRVAIGNQTLFLVAGRNLNNPEQLTSYLLLVSGLIWAGTIMISLFFAALSLPRTRERARKAWRGIGKTRV